MKNRLQECLNAFQKGDPILVGDDGLRENEVDLVFHALHATAFLVNFAITFAKGLLCVSLSHELANKLGFGSAPCYPGGISHTNFTLSVDAKEGITTGISAQDRAYTISLMTTPHVTPQDFLSPGHVFPLRAMNGGLLARTGHTEALYELCHMAKLPCAAAMCEILDDSGQSLSPKNILNSPKKYPQFSKLPFVTTVDILWYKILFEHSSNSFFQQAHDFLHSPQQATPRAVYILQKGLEKNLTLDVIITIYHYQFSPENLRMSITNLAHIWDNSVSLKSCCAEISLFSLGNCLEPLPLLLKDFCQINCQEGLGNTKTSVQRMLSLLRCFQFLKEFFKFEGSMTHLLEKTNFIQNDDKEFLYALYTEAEELSTNF
jgi:3,4-dihydroxy 2-butanone 4-phosphate synthase/GTP cyclohydrolase II